MRVTHPPAVTAVGDRLEEADQVGISAEINGRGNGLRHHERARPASKPGSGGTAKGAPDRLSGVPVLALGIPLAYLLISTAILLKGDLELARFVQRLSSRDALLWNTMVGITIAVGAVRWALSW